MKRMLDLAPSELTGLARHEFLYAVRSAEGRTLACETIVPAMPMLVDISNAELAAALSADFIILNMFDCISPRINGIAEEGDEAIRSLKKLCGRPVFVNLEPCEASNDTSIWAMKEGRKASGENAASLMRMGADGVVITGNPGNGVTNDGICRSVSEIRKACSDGLSIIAGKMHASGSLAECGENIITKEDISSFVSAGADIILLPAPMTVPGLSTEYIRTLVSYAHSLDVLTMTSIGTSQEGSDTETIRQIALSAKMCGTDVHHLGDSGYMGMALPENIFTYSVAIRGVRHTYRRMASSRR